MDNIRWLMIVLVVMVHAAVTYSNLGHWYYREPVELDPPTFLFFGIFLSFTQAYFMGLLFLIAGYFVPDSFDRKGPAKFLRDRAVRLGIPTLIYMLFINPGINYYLLAFQWQGPRPPLGQAYMNYILRGAILSGSGPMWFALALLIFSAAYAAYRLLTGSRMSPKPEPALPGHLHVAGLILLIAVGAFAIRLVQPIGTSVMNMQLCYFSSYIVLFIVGIQARQNNWLMRIPRSFALSWFKAALAGGTAFWLAIMILGGMASGDLSPIWGGWRWQSAAFALWEAFFAVGACLGIIAMFREHFNCRGRLTGPLSDSSFSVYLFHPPILILICLALRNLAWHPLIKFALCSALALPLCFLAGYFIFRRIPLLKRVL
ncbi:MAG: acyltransferase family protein [Syntrophomonas sp.]|nr:acyltransferase family protein [Syntrophomonas sp.]